MITLDPNHFGFQRGRPERRKKSGEIVKEEKKVSNPRPTSVVVSWVGRCKARANLNGGELDFEYATGTHKGSEGGGLQARANLNGGELDKEPFLRDKRGQTTMTWVQKRKTKDNAQPPDRPKWRRVGARACQKCQDKEKIEDAPEWWRGAVNPFRSHETVDWSFSSKTTQPRAGAGAGATAHGAVSWKPPFRYLPPGT